MAFDPKELRNFVIALGLGGFTGAAIIKSHHDEEAKSQAEREDPDGCMHHDIEARIFVVRPEFSMPAAEWVASDPSFWDSQAQKK